MNEKNHSPHYTAILEFNHTEINRFSGNDLSKLMARLLIEVEKEKKGTTGRIIDNLTGETIHESRKQAPE